MKIKLETAVQFLSDATAVLMDDDIMTMPTVDGLTGSDDNEFLTLAYDFGGMNNGCWMFAEGDNREVEVNWANMTLIDTDGEKITMMLLVPLDMEEVKIVAS